MRKVLRHRLFWFLLLVAAGALGFRAAGAMADSRRHLRSAETDVELARDLFGERQYAAAQQHLNSARGHVAEAEGANHRVSVRVLNPVPVLGSGGRAVRSAAGAARALLDAGDLLVDEAAAVERLLSDADGHSLSAVHEAVGHSQQVLATITVQVRRASEALAGAAGAWLPQVSGPARQLRSRLLEDVARMERIGAGLDLAGELTASDTDVRLLLLAQDTMELRPTGGYIGSFGVVRIAGGSAHLERYESFEALPPANPPMDPPDDLERALRYPWSLENVNWWPDFPTSAAAAREMFRRQGGGEVDGVVAVTELAMADLVGVLGPIHLPSYADPVVEKGFDQRVLYEVELKRPLDQPRKRFLAELADAVLARALGAGDLVPDMAASAARSVGAGDVQLWFTDPARQAALDGTAIAGALPHVDGDFLMLSEANMTASKANAELVRDVDYHVERRSDGRLAAHLRIRYDNRGAASPVNPHYNGLLSVYVPRGSLPLLGTVARPRPAADGPYDVLSTSVFVEPEGTTEVRLDYLLPREMAPGGRYELTWIRQAGTPDDHLRARVGESAITGSPDRREMHLTATL